jgi:hypothetical protein
MLKILAAVGVTPSSTWPWTDPTVVEPSSGYLVLDNTNLGPRLIVQWGMSDADGGVAFPMEMETVLAVIAHNTDELPRPVHFTRKYAMMGPRAYWVAFGLTKD